MEREAEDNGGENLPYQSSIEFQKTFLLTLQERISN